MAAFSIRHYNDINDLKSSIIDGLRSLDVEANLNKPHFRYFSNYFQHFNLQTILLEEEYVDNFFLEDYSTYYSKCFSKHRSRCVRLHFFSKDFNSDYFCCLLSEGRAGVAIPIDSNLSDELGYLGFMVIRPLKQRYIGRTCLQTYRPEGRRHFPIRQCYKVNLFGLPLQVETLAFQEQDPEVGACATSAVWCALQATSLIFQHKQPSPIEITKDPSISVLSTNRAAPSSGMNEQQVSHVLRGYSLDPECFRPSTAQEFAGICYAYSRAGIPAIALLPMWTIEGPHPNVSNADSISPYDGHAICITGYSLTPTGKDVDRELNSTLRLSSNAIDKLYAHDDGIGPFSRITIDGRLIADGKKDCSQTLATDWKNGTKSVRFSITGSYLILPVDTMIRITYPQILQDVSAIDAVLNPLISHLTGKSKSAFGWDVYLSKSNDFKESMHQNPDLTPSAREAILVTNLPKFVWIAEFHNDNKPMFSLLYDSTEVGDGKPYVASCVFDNEQYATIKEVLPMLGLP